MTNHLPRTILIAMPGFSLVTPSKAETLTAARNQLAAGMVVAGAVIGICQP